MEDATKSNGLSRKESVQAEELARYRATKVALITGISGQDGSYLAELLLSKGYKVHGVIRRSSSFNTARIAHLYTNPVTHSSPDASFNLHYGDMTDSSCLIKLISTIQPTEVYHLAAQSHVKVSFDLPEYTAEVRWMDLWKEWKSKGMGFRWMRWAHSDCWTLSMPVGWRGRSDSTRPPPLSSTARCRRSLSGRQLRSTLALPTRWRSSTPIGSWSTTERPTGCSAAMGFCSTTRVREEVGSFCTSQ